MLLLLLLLFHMMRCPSGPGNSDHVQAFHHFVYCPCSGTPTIYSYGGAFYDSGSGYDLDRTLDRNGRALTDLAVAEHFFRTVLLRSERAVLEKRSDGSFFPITRGSSNSPIMTLQQGFQVDSTLRVYETWDPMKKLCTNGRRPSDGFLSHKRGWV